MEEEGEKVPREPLKRYYPVKKVIVIDTNILIDYVNGFAPWLGDMLKQERWVAELVLPTIVIAEYFTSKEFEREYEVKVAEETFALFVKQDLTEAIAKVLGTLLRRKTYPSSASIADLIVASTTIYLNGELATKNRRDFAAIPHLRFFEPKKLKISS